MYVTKQGIISGTLALDRISELYLLMKCSEKSSMTFSHSPKKSLFLLLQKILSNNKGQSPGAFQSKSGFLPS